GGVILVLGGTAEGRAVAQVLLDRGMPAMLSLAGRTSQPLTAGPVRSGGFGGVDGLAAYLRAEDVTAVIDATHPFAEAMTRHAVQACGQVGVPLVRLARPGWGAHPLAAQWHWVDGHAQAARATRELGGRVLLTVGRQHTLDYASDLGDRVVVARVAEPPTGVMPPPWVLLCARGPFVLAGERELLTEHGITVLVTKDSGGAHTEAKLLAAAEQGTSVVMIRRPVPPDGLTQVSTIDDVVDWLP
ncbi:cobalt-precorrin-6A reductase, partial [Tessaracoccus sp.]